MAAISDDKKDQQQTEQTPKGLTVPVPRRHEFFANLKNVAEPDKAPGDDDRRKPKGAEDIYGESWIDRS